MKLIDPVHHDTSCPLDAFQFRDLVAQTLQALQALQALLHDSQKIKDRYRCQEASWPTATDLPQRTDLTHSLAIAFSNVQPGHRIKET